MGVVFAVGLLASGLASTSVGAYAGSEVMKGLLHIDVPLTTRRLVTLIPALAILAFGVDATFALVLSQVVLSFGIPLVLVPLQLCTADRALMGDFRDCAALRIGGRCISGLIIALNLALLGLLAAGRG